MSGYILDHPPNSLDRFFHTFLSPDFQVEKRYLGAPGKSEIQRLKVSQDIGLFTQMFRPQR